MYVDITPGHDWLTQPVNRMLEAADDGHAVNKIGGVWEKVSLAESPIARLTPFFEPMGKPGNTRREWWWEREWRKVGNLMFAWWDLVAVLVPEDDFAAFAAR